MAAPWFDPNAWSWIPGTALGVLGGTIGPMIGILAPRGKARGFVLGTVVVMILVSLALLGVAAYARLAGQPFGIWYGFGLPGVIGSIVFTMCYGVARNTYRTAELRKSQAVDLE